MLSMYKFIFKPSHRGVKDRAINLIHRKSWTSKKNFFSLNTKFSNTDLIMASLPLAINKFSIGVERCLDSFL